MLAVGAIDDGRSADGCMSTEVADDAAEEPLELGIFELAWTARLASMTSVCGGGHF